jgi:hypothetical protein
MLEILQPTKAKLIKFETLSQKNRPADEKPGVKALIEMQLPNGLLDSFDPSLKPWLYEKAGQPKARQGELDGVPVVTDAPNLTQAGIKIGKFVWHQDMTGYTASIVRGAGVAPANVLKLADCILGNWRMTLKEGGTVVARFDLEAPAIPDHGWILLAALKSRECDITLQPPEVNQADLDAEEKAREKMGDAAPPRKAGPAERAALAKNGKEPVAPPVPKRKPKKAEMRAAAESAFKKPGEGEAPAGPGTPTPEGAWPFPQKGTGATTPPGQSVTIERSQPGTRTARGRDATTAFLAEQAKKQAEAGKETT